MSYKSRPKATGTPKTWRKSVRMTPMTRFKMYNPLQMEFSMKPLNARTNVNYIKKQKTNNISKYKQISFGLNRKNQHQLQRMHIQGIRRSKKQMLKSIQKTMNNAPGSITVTGAEKTFEITQSEIAHNIDHNTNKKIFNLDLTEYGSYKICYTSNGQYLALGGNAGHLAIIRWKDFRLLSEEYFNNDDYINDICFAFNESMICTAQRTGVYIYNSKCVETHVLRRSIPFPLALSYLQYHFLLCSIGMQGNLVYFDISVGKKITMKRTKLGECDMICNNPLNGIIHLGHNNGCVTLWSPTNEQPCARILCHKFCF